MAKDKEMFDDLNLIRLAQLAVKDPTDAPKVARLFNKTELTNSERNELIKFVYFERGSSMSASAMKKEILRMIGYTGGYVNNYGPLQKPEIEAIYIFLKENAVKKQST